MVAMSNLFLGAAPPPVTRGWRFFATPAIPAGLRQNRGKAYENSRVIPESLPSFFLSQSRKLGRAQRADLEGRLF
jgi:hypothetical protein